MAEGIGAWEKHTKGIGLKLLQKFGFKGRLGANEDGTAATIEVSVRPNRVGLGFGDSNESSKASSTLPPNATKKRAAAAEGPTDGWKRVKYSKLQAVSGAKLIEKMMQESQQEQPEANLIIDMRSKEVRILSDFRNVGSTPDEPLPSVCSIGQELLVNLDILECKYDLIMKRSLRVGSTARYSEEGSRTGEHELHAANDRQQLRTLQMILDRLQQIEGFLSARPVDVAVVFEAIHEAARLAPAMFRAASGHAFATSMVDTAMQEYQRRFEGLEFAEIVASVRVFRRLCDDWAATWAKAGDDALCEAVRRSADRVCDRAIVPKLQMYLSEREKVFIGREVVVAAQLVGDVRTIVGDEGWGYVISTTIAPALKAEVQELKVEHVMRGGLDALVMPWLPVAGLALSSIFPIIRRRLAQALSQMLHFTDEHRSDVGLCALSIAQAADIISPWVKVFDQASMDALLERSVLPALSHAVRTLVRVDPSNQELAMVNAMLRWSEVLALEQLACLVCADVLAPWLRVAREWLAAGDCDLREVADWYEGWSTVFTALRRHELVLEVLHAALVMMDVRRAGCCGVEFIGRFQPLLDRARWDFFTLYRERKSARSPIRRLGMRAEPVGAQQAHMYTPGYAPPSSLKEVLSSLAEHRGVEFAPHKVDPEGRQLWKFGGQVLFFQDNIVFTQEQGVDGRLSWRPVGVERLLEGIGAR